MRVGVVATMGTSPPVVTEFVDYVERTEKVSNLMILSTSEKLVRESAVLASAAITDRFPHIRVKTIEVPVTDITSEEENYLFMETAAKALSELRRNSDKLYVCLAGGRKEMVASMTLLAQLNDVDAVYHVISPEIKVVSAALERIRKEIEELANSQNPQEYYKQKREEFDPVMYPPPTDYNVIHVPVIPYPPETLSSLKSLLAKGSSPRRGVKLHAGFLYRLRNRGLISMTSDKIIVTDHGRKLYDALLKYL
ncbi:MAG: CRISPR-associated protein Csx14 [Candidatus Caldarchaeum sp.]